MPRVSVIIPTYNVDSWLKESINRVLSQAFTDYELIVIDDGSTDNTQGIVESLGDKRIRYFYKSNGGVASARNMGLDKAVGEYIAFLDSDDLWPDCYLETMVLALDIARDYDIAYTAITQNYPDGAVIEHARAKYCISGSITCPLFNKMFVHVQASVWRRTVLEQFRFDEQLRTCEDYDVFLRVSLRAKFLFVPDIKVVRRVRKDSLSPHSFSSVVDCNMIMVRERFYFVLGGRSYIPRREALHRIAQTYKQTARRYYSNLVRKASVYLFKKAFLYNPFDLKIIGGLIRSLLIKKKNDTMPDWEMPGPLGEPIAQDYGKVEATAGE
jgi:glycosyltransferase involved in cell wall biosynthesis